MAASKLFDVQGHVILITGASSGLGEHFARLFAKAGATVVLAARRETLLKSLVADLEAAGGKAAAVAMDVSSRESVQRAVAEVLAKQGRIDTLVSNAGVLVDGKAAQNHTEEDWHSVLGTNLSGSWRVAAEVASQWMLKNGGNIVMVGSVLADRQVRGSAAYLAAKAGLHQLTKALALEWASKNIRVNAIAPGYVLTDLTGKIFLKEGASPDAKGDDKYSDAGRQFVKGIPMRSFVELDDLDGPMMLLCSGASRKMTGSVVTVDAGHTVSSL